MKGWEKFEGSCPVCQKEGNCCRSEDGRTYCCWRRGHPPEGFTHVKSSGGSHIYRKGSNLASLHAECLQNIKYESLADLARDLDVEFDSLKALEVGWAGATGLRQLGAGGSWKSEPSGAYTIPERDEAGNIIGIALRTPNGEKGAGSKKKGSKRGLTYSLELLASSEEIVLVVEGMSDVAAGISAGFEVVGRPSNTGGADHLKGLLKNREIIVLGENDQKESGAWPGRDGAVAVAQKLADLLQRSVPVGFPPGDAKDLRECWRREGLLEMLKANAELIHPSLAEKAESETLLNIVLEKRVPAQNQLGEPILTPKEGGGVAFPITHSGISFANKEFHVRYGKVSKRGSRNDIVDLLNSMALEGEVVETHNRTAKVGDTLIYDLGIGEESFVHISPRGVEILDETSVYFLRSNLKRQSSPMLPGDFLLLEKYLTVSGDAFHAVIVWILTVLTPGVPTPVLILTATEGSGKSVQAAFLARLADPSASHGRSLPRDEERWQNTVHGIKLLFLDNASTIPGWLSDLLCMAVTGHSFQKRKLYTDGDIFERKIQIAILITTIELGQLRPDLADRSFILRLPRLTDEQHVAETKIREAFEKDLPAIFGGILTALSKVQAALPAVRWTGLSRMADFERHLLAYDQVFHTSTHKYYRNLRDSVSGEIVMDNPFASWLVSFLSEERTFQGKASKLFGLLPKNGQGDPLEGFPKNARAVSAALNRLDRVLERIGIRYRKNGRAISLTLFQTANISQKEKPILGENFEKQASSTSQTASFAKSATQGQRENTEIEKAFLNNPERGICGSSEFADDSVKPGNDLDWGTP